MCDVETRTGVIIIDEDLGIIRIRHKPDVLQTIEDARANLAELAKVTGGRPVPVLVYMEGASLDRDVRAYYAGPEMRKHMCALAMVVLNPVERVLGNFFLAMIGTGVPTRMFSSENEALSWLRGFASPGQVLAR